MKDLDSEESFQVMSFQFTWMTGKPQDNLSQYASRALGYTELFGRFQAPLGWSNQSVLDGGPAAYTKWIRNMSKIFAKNLNRRHRLKCKNIGGNMRLKQMLKTQDIASSCLVCDRVQWVHGVNMGVRTLGSIQGGYFLSCLWTSSKWLCSVTLNGSQKKVALK